MITIHDNEKYINWRNKSFGYIHEFFEQELKWVRYCDHGISPCWVTESNNFNTLENRNVIILQKIFDLTGYINK